MALLHSSNGPFGLLRGAVDVIRSRVVAPSHEAVGHPFE
jgi:hypothetical protein